MDAWPELDRSMHQLADLGRMSALLSWDQQVLMPEHWDDRPVLAHHLDQTFTARQLYAASAPDAF